MVFSLIGALKKRKMSPKLQLLSSNGEPVVVPFEAVYAKPGIREQLDQLIDQDKENREVIYDIARNTFVEVNHELELELRTPFSRDALEHLSKVLKEEIVPMNFVDQEASKEVVRMYHTFSINTNVAVVPNPVVDDHFLSGQRELDDVEDDAEEETEKRKLIDQNLPKLEKKRKSDEEEILWLRKTLYLDKLDSQLTGNLGKGNLINDKWFLLVV